MNLYEVLYDGSDGIARERFKADYARIDEAGNLKFFNHLEGEPVACFDDMNWIGWKLIKSDGETQGETQERRPSTEKTVHPYLVVVDQVVCDVSREIVGEVSVGYAVYAAYVTEHGELGLDLGASRTFFLNEGTWSSARNEITDHHVAAINRGQAV